MLRKCLLIIFMAVLAVSTANAAIGESWNLRDDFSITNGNANVVGDGMCSFMQR